MIIEVDNATIKIPNFQKEEFSCPCCDMNNIKDRFLWKLQNARTEAQIPFVINSGCRCAKHNKLFEGKRRSDHLTGEGADIRCMNSRDRWRIINGAVKAGIRRIGIRKTFVHLGDRWDNPQGVIWLY